MLQINQFKKSSFNTWSKIFLATFLTRFISFVFNSIVLWKRAFSILKNNQNTCFINMKRLKASIRTIVSSFVPISLNYWRFFRSNGVNTNSTTAISTTLVGRPAYKISTDFILTLPWLAKKNKRKDTKKYKEILSLATY